MVVKLEYPMSSAGALVHELLVKMVQSAAQSGRCILKKAL